MKETYKNWGIPLTVNTKRNSSGKNRDNKIKKKEVLQTLDKKEMTAYSKQIINIRTITGISKQRLKQGLTHD